MPSKLMGLLDEFMNRFVFLCLSMGSLTEIFLILINNNEVIFSVNCSEFSSCELYL